MQHLQLKIDILTENKKNIFNILNTLYSDEISNIIKYAKKNKKYGIDLLKRYINEPFYIYLIKLYSIQNMIDNMNCPDTDFIRLNKFDSIKY